MRAQKWRPPYGDGEAAGSGPRALDGLTALVAPPPTRSHSQKLSHQDHWGQDLNEREGRLHRPDSPANSGAAPRESGPVGGKEQGNWGTGRRGLESRLNAPLGQAWRVHNRRGDRGTSLGRSQKSSTGSHHWAARSQRAGSPGAAPPPTNTTPVGKSVPSPSDELTDKRRDPPPHDLDAQVRSPRLG